MFFGTSIFLCRKLLCEWQLDTYNYAYSTSLAAQAANVLGKEEEAEKFFHSIYSPLMINLLNVNKSPAYNDLSYTIVDRKKVQCKCSQRLNLKLCKLYKFSFDRKFI